MSRLKLSEIEITELKRLIEEMKLDLEVVDTTLGVAEELSVDGRTLPIFAKNSLADAATKLHAFVGQLKHTMQEIKQRHQAGRGTASG